MQCEYCSSRIFETDRVCPRCGAPNITHFETLKPGDPFGLWIKDIETQTPAEFAVFSGSAIACRAFPSTGSTVRPREDYFRSSIQDQMNKMFRRT